jgi:ABC-type polysaccharide/polyol phosphate transport system ATPase subunit
VVVENVSKTFRLPHERVQTLKERALHPFRGRQIDDLHALQDVSFDVRQGEFFGIVGRNGSGKSTLLKCLAGIYGTDAGHIRLRGRMATFIELGVGFNTDLTARDNVVINAIMLGLTPTEARDRYDAVIDFAELHEFEDLKLKNYSSGMFVRLAFATMIQVDADILLIDEVLAVGDVSFQQKCHEVLEQIRRRGRTILFVTHDMATVEANCDRALLLERGTMMELGDPDLVSSHYDQLNFRRQADLGGDDDDGLRRGDGTGRVLDAWVEDEHGMRTATVERGRPCSIHVEAQLNQDAEEPIVGFRLGTEHIPSVFATNTQMDGCQTGSFSAGDRVHMTVAIELPLGPGRYSISPSIAHGVGSHPFMDARENFASVIVTGTRAATSLVEVPHTTRLERASGDRPVAVEVAE